MSHTQLTLKQRFKIESLLEINWLQKDIAEHIGVNSGTISREISRNSANKYDARKAQAKMRKRRKKGKRKSKKLLNNKEVYVYVESRLKKHWSPEQISGRGKRKLGFMVSYETIYQFIYQEKPEWKKYLRQKKGKYRRRHGTKIREKWREEAKKRRIDTRDKIIDKRERIGDWEGDTIVGREKTTGIITHVDRKSGYLLADLFKSKKAEVIRKKTVSRFSRVASDKKHTIIYDNGVEFSEYEFIERYTGMTIYFAYPYHSWERGTNENTNGLLRQFFPKKSMFGKLRQKDVDEKVKLINNRPRKRLSYLTPYEVFIEGKIAIQAGM